MRCSRCLMNKRRLIPALLMLAGGALIILGVARSEHVTVLRKAVLICLECIGIG